MRFSAQEEYGLRCLLQMARHEEESMTIPEIARREGLTVAYVGKLMRVLREEGLVHSTRGQQGGYQLTRSASQVSLAEVLTALGGKLYSTDFCDRFAGNEAACVHIGDCSIRSAWSSLYSIFGHLLKQIMLKDLVRSESSMAKWVQTYVEPPSPQSLKVLGTSNS